MQHNKGELVAASTARSAWSPGRLSTQLGVARERPAVLQPACQDADERGVRGGRDGQVIPAAVGRDNNRLGLARVEREGLRASPVGILESQVCTGGSGVLDPELRVRRVAIGGDGDADVRCRGRACEVQFVAGGVGM